MRRHDQTAVILQRIIEADWPLKGYELWCWRCSWWSQIFETKAVDLDMELESSCLRWHGRRTELSDLRAT
jgi:hypothetical protein